MPLDMTFARLKTALTMRFGALRKADVRSTGITPRTLYARKRDRRIREYMNELVHVYTYIHKTSTTTTTTVHVTS